MAAITANLLAATAPPVNPPVPKGGDPTPSSGFANVLTERVKRKDVSNDRTAPEPPTDSDLPDDADTPAGTTPSQTALAALGLVNLPVTPIVVVAPSPTAASGTAVPTNLTDAVPTTNVAPGTTPITDPQASRVERLRFSTQAGVPTTTTAIDTPAGVTTPATLPADLPTTARGQAPAAQPVVPQQTVAVPVATTPAEVTATATRPQPVAPQVPVLTDRVQQLPALPPEVGYGLLNPNVNGPQQVEPVAPAGAGRTQTQVELTAAGLKTPTEPNELPSATRSLPATPEVTPQSFTEVLAYQAANSPASDRELSPDGTAAAGMGANPNQFMASDSVPDPSVRATPVAQPGVASQLSDAFVTHARVVERGGVHEFQLRLDPPELGEVKVRVLAMGDRIEARLVVTDDAVKRLIESQLPELRQRLEAAGVSVPKFDVTTNGDGRANTGGGWDRPQAENPPSVPPHTPTKPSPRRPVAGGLLDVTA